MKVLIKTFGCSANLSNSEVMAGLLEGAGHKLVGSVADADIVIINTCVVKGPTENKVVKEIRSVLKSNKQLVVAGCMPKAEYALVKKIAPYASLIGPKHADRIIEAVNARREFVGEGAGFRPDLPKKRKNRVIGITQLSTGCTGNCSYCIVKLAKGELFSFPPDSIVNDVECSVKDNCKEIWLTSQDNAAYGVDSGTSLPELLYKIFEVKGSFKMRIGMMDPDNVSPIIKRLIRAYKNEKVFKFLHLPVQSGSDEVLQRMNRKYSVGEFKKIVKEFQKQIPKITVSTDIIVGFPGETEQQFEESLKLVKEIKPDVLNISRFWPRPGTAAASMQPQIQGNTTKERSKKLTAEFEKIALSNNKKWVGWKGPVLVDEKGRGDSWVGRNFAYKPVVIHSKRNLLGKEIIVEVSGATNHALMTRNHS